VETETSLVREPHVNFAQPGGPVRGGRTSSSYSIPPTRPRIPVHLEVIIPAYNEAERIPATLGATVDFLASQPWSSRIVVVDNGSVDATSAVVRRLARASGAVDIHLMGCAQPGKGAAVRRGLLSSRANFAGFVDADLATPIATLEAAMTYLEAGASAVIASRHAPGATFVQPQQLGRRVGGTAFRLMTRRMVQGIADTQCGFKFFEVGAVKRALVECRTMGFAFDVELLQRIQHTGGRILEVPVAWTDGSGSTFRPVRDGIASFGAVLKMHRGF
jgi:dolichyl-phosphate beta-glucosyltransferase